MAAPAKLTVQQLIERNKYVSAPNLIHIPNLMLTPPKSPHQNPPAPPSPRRTHDGRARCSPLRSQSVTPFPLPTRTQIPKQSKIPGIDKNATVTCADPRCVPESFLATTPADGLVTFRNVGGHITPQVITDILALDGFMGITGILVVHHTDCGTTHFKDAAIREGLKARVPSRAAEIEGMGFGAIEDLPQSVRDDIAKLRSSPLVREELKGEVYGFVYDIKTGALGAVEA